MTNRAIVTVNSSFLFPSFLYIDCVIASFCCWKKQESEQQCWKFVKSHGMDMATLNDMDQLHGQFTELLQDAGFIPSSNTNADEN